MSSKKIAGTKKKKTVLSHLLVEMLSDNCKIILLDYKSTGNVAKYCLNRV